MISFSSYADHFVRWTRTVCAIFVEIKYEEHSCENIFNLGLWFRMRCCFNIFLFLALMAIFSAERNRL